MMTGILCFIAGLIARPVAEFLLFLAIGVHIQMTRKPK